MSDMNKETDFVPKCMKISVLLVTVLSWFLGICTTGAGVYVHVYQMVLIQELIFLHFSPAFMLIIMGVILFITATLGFVGALRENICFLRWYLVIQLFLLMVHTGMGAVACIVLFSPPIFSAHAEDALQVALLSFQDDKNLADYIDKVQTTLQCCGIGQDGYKDWMLNPYFACVEENKSSERCGIPASCCRLDSLERIDLTCGYGATDANFFERISTINTQGCIPKAEEMILNAAGLLVFFSFGIAATLLGGIIFTSRALSILELKVHEYWERSVLQNNVIPTSSSVGIYHIPVHDNLKLNVPTKKSKVCQNLSKTSLKRWFL